MKDLCGMVLAAGYGQRLLPATRYRPKPLLDFFGVPLLYLAFKQLEDAGCQTIVVNTHYLADQLEDAVRAWPGHAQILISRETEILGTGGGIARIHELREGRDLLVVNSDLVHLYDLNRFISDCQGQDALAFMALRPDVRKGEPSLWCKDGQVLQIGHERPDILSVTPYGYACIQLLSDEFLCRMRDAKAGCVIRFYQDLLKRREKVAGSLQSCFWYDVGTPESYWAAHCAYLNLMMADSGELPDDPLKINQIRKMTAKNRIRWYVGNRSLSENYAVIEPCAIEDGVSFDENGQIGPFAIIMGKLHIYKGIRIKSCLLHRSGIFEIASDLENLWMHDYFMMTHSSS